EDQLQEARAKIRTIHPLARVGEQELLDHVADMIVVTRGCGAPATIEMEWKIDVHADLISRLRAFGLRRSSAACPSARRSPDCFGQAAAVHWRRRASCHSPIVRSRRVRSRRAEEEACTRRLHTATSSIPSAG